MGGHLKSPGEVHPCHMSTEVQPSCLDEPWQLRWETGLETNINIGNMIHIGNPKNMSRADVVKDNDLIFQGPCFRRFQMDYKYKQNMQFRLMAMSSD